MAGYLLIGLTLAAAIIGTLSETNRWIKSGLICIAVMASVAAGWLQFEAEAEAKLDRTLIASLVQSLRIRPVSPRFVFSSPTASTHPAA